MRTTDEEIEEGSRCYQCKKYLVAGLLSSVRRRRRCHQCTKADDPGELDHDKFLRCPGCGHLWDPYEAEETGVFEEGPHDVRCPRCDREFEVETTISYSFTSPERSDEPDDD
jgi:uncharacterized C2H2 Zn-finger protein